MTGFQRPPWATCKPEDPLHESGHIARSFRIRRPGGFFIIGFKCVGCGKNSRTWTPFKEAP